MLKGATRLVGRRRISLVEQRARILSHYNRARLRLDADRNCGRITEITYRVRCTALKLNRDQAVADINDELQRWPRGYVYPVLLLVGLAFYMGVWRLVA